MKIKRVNFHGMITKILIIEEGDEPVPCENCGGAKFDHPDLVREVDDDWCLNCNDDAMGLSPEEYKSWLLKQATQDKIMFIASEVVE